MLIQRVLRQAVNGLELAISHAWVRFCFGILAMLSVTSLAISFTFSSNVDITWLSRGAAFFFIWLAVVLFSFYIDKARHTV